MTEKENVIINNRKSRIILIFYWLSVYLLNLVKSKFFSYLIDRKSIFFLNIADFLKLEHM